MCCAGIGRDGKWRRQYPVPFRILNEGQKFRRWDFIQYEFTKSSDDHRSESQKVIPESIVVTGEIKKSERARILNPLVRPSFAVSDELAESLTLLRPSAITLAHTKKSTSEMEHERVRHAELANQLSIFDNTAKPLEPCPIQFVLKWKDADGKSRQHECDDWETSSAFMRFQREHGEERAIEILRDKYENQYFSAGLALAFSTHKRRNKTNAANNQWLLVGLIRLDENLQRDLFLGAN